MEFSSQIEERMRASQRRKSLRPQLNNLDQSVAIQPKHSQSCNPTEETVPDKIPPLLYSESMLASRLISKEHKP